ncbi:MAG TPA: amidase, partial [Opitutus sp.]|nr:amidase [Opitutus sp.]
MTFRDWQLLAPDAAARELHHRVRERLSSAQQRAVLAFLPDEPSLTRAFETSNRTAPLGGVPYLLKDLFDVAGLPTFGGSTF